MCRVWWTGGQVRDRVDWRGLFGCLLSSRGNEGYLGALISDKSIKSFFYWSECSLIGRGDSTHHALGSQRRCDIGCLVSCVNLGL
jgi:hypothetical protein